MFTGAVSHGSHSSLPLLLLLLQFYDRPLVGWPEIAWQSEWVRVVNVSLDACDPTLINIECWSPSPSAIQARQGRTGIKRDPCSRRTGREWVYIPFSPFFLWICIKIIPLESDEWNVLKVIQFWPSSIKTNGIKLHLVGQNRNCHNHHYGQRRRRLSVGDTDGWIVWRNGSILTSGIGEQVRESPFRSDLLYVNVNHHQQRVDGGYLYLLGLCVCGPVSFLGFLLI